MPNQEDRRVSKILWSMVSKAADRSRRQRQEILREPMALILYETRDDTKAAARQSLNCIKNKKYNMAKKTIFNMADGILTLCNVARS